MVQVAIQKPADQPTGALRLLDGIRRCLQSSDYDDFRLIVAFAKVGPLLRLKSDLDAWTSKGCTVKAIVGIDQQGTSKQALEFCLGHFSEVHIAHAAGPFSPTFHPKIYLFTGPTRAVAYVGSSNLTVGGLETNFESSIRLDLVLPADQALKSDLTACWTDGLRAALPLTPALLAQLVSAGIVPDEQQARRVQRAAATARTSATGTIALPFPALPLVAPSAIPRSSLPARQPAAPPATLPGVLPPPTVLQGSGAQALVMQIIPHHNGEILLSKNAVNQDPAFFGWPFTGMTVPKRSGNPAYPQRVPDPIIDLQVFDTNGNLVMSIGA